MSVRELFPEFSPVGKEDPSHSPGSALPLGVPRLRSSPRGHLGFHQNVVSSKHLDSSRLMFQRNNNRPPSSTRPSYLNTGRPLEDSANHTTGRISQDCRRRRTNGDQSDGSSLYAFILCSWTTERCFSFLTLSPFLTLTDAETTRHQLGHFGPRSFKCVVLEQKGGSHLVVMLQKSRASTNQCSANFVLYIEKRGL